MYIYTYKYIINSSLCSQRAREVRVAALGPLHPNHNGVAVGGGGGVEPITQVTYNNPVTLATPFDPSSVLPLLDYSEYEQHYVKFPVMEPVPNNFPTSFDRQ
ncbi:hypothetical protein RclHR1_00370032 [Rhizophagus clarus]|uniref:Uncharacterized protein n=1 Tax=Rhizophagus clarus TaxID=94130 RepID=A0A2Z6RTU5_9GLOM|nr:hypothetical protein RclHR1_00370032 [Rhizophagus clarus]